MDDYVTKPVINLNICGWTTPTFIDTGSCVALIWGEHAHRLSQAKLIKIKPTKIDLYTVGNDLLAGLGKAVLRFGVGQTSILHRAIITRGAIHPADLLLGTAFLKRFGKVSIDFTAKKVGLREDAYPMVAWDQEPGTGNVKILKRDVRQVLAHLAHTIQVPPYSTVDVELDLPQTVDGQSVIEGISSLSGARMDRELVNIVKGKCKVRLSNEEGEIAKVTPEVCTIIAHKVDADIEIVDEQPDCTGPDLQHLDASQQLEVGEVLKQNQEAFYFAWNESRTLHYGTAPYWYR